LVRGCSLGIILVYFNTQDISYPSTCIELPILTCISAVQRATIQAARSFLQNMFSRLNLVKIAPFLGSEYNFLINRLIKERRQAAHTIASGVEYLPMSLFCRDVTDYYMKHCPPLVNCQHKRYSISHTC